MTSITREARGTSEMEANIAPLTSTFEQPCSPQNWCKTSTKPRLWPLVMVGILRVLVLYGPVGMWHHVNMADWKIHWFPWLTCLVGMLRDTIVPSQHTKTRRFLLRCGRPGLQGLFDLDFPQQSRWPHQLLGDGAAAQWYPTLPISPAFLVILFCPEEFSSLFDPVFLGCDVFLSSNKMTTGEGEGEFQRECRICWILSKMNWLVLLQPTNFVFIPCKFPQVP